MGISRRATPQHSQSLQPHTGPAQRACVPRLSTRVQRRMRPLQLTGSSRPVSHVIYGRDGDCLFTASKDSSAAMWYTHNGERVGCVAVNPVASGCSAARGEGGRFFLCLGPFLVPRRRAAVTPDPHMRAARTTGIVVP